MNVPTLAPLRFAPIFQPRLWGGRRLGELFRWALPEGPIGEAWVLSDRDDYPSRVADGPWQGWTIRRLLEAHADQLLGRHAELHRRFPLLLKFLDARDTLSVQVHPSDAHHEHLPPGERGKTEAWLVLHADPGSKIYAGVWPDASAAALRAALEERTLAQRLPSFAPQPGDGIFLPAGAIHALGGGLAIFECQQNSDVTFRLYDWDRTDAQTGKPRALHIEQAIACTDFSLGPVGPTAPVVETNVPVLRESLFRCAFFHLQRLTGRQPFRVGAAQECRVLIGLQGQAQLEYQGGLAALGPGDVLLVPASVGVCNCRPVAPAGQPENVVLLEVALPK
ncbi:MAG: class I mannose-6-phosphate isomerase [Planctomycetia bacterium]|nr:class I mannose-6-phosphate isomerase [Planctomycetia bacterium]